jgi:hypothetical protein
MDWFKDLFIDEAKAALLNKRPGSSGGGSSEEWIGDGNTHIWYTTAPELGFYHGFRRLGEHARAEQILNTLLQCTVTKEYYVSERINDEDPWFVPWMPNASGMGRILWMLLDSCKY